MDQQTNKQKPSSTKGGQVKVGDKVWVKCEVVEANQHLIKVTPSGRDNWFWAGRGQCRPVEPVVKDSLTTESNSPEIPDSSSEQIQVGDAVRFVSPGHDRHGTEGIILSIVRGPNRQYRFDSNCGQFHRYCTASELELTTKRYRTPTLADLVNGPIDCEVRDYHDEPWTPRRLVCVHRTRARRFLTEIAVLWNQCRIEAGE